ncbi:MAG: TonB-dependent receptor [Acidobacteria bacterium]|nr:TonB-dependent receptor [Acidobacteriota bacterium]
MSKRMRLAATFSVSLLLSLALCSLALLAQVTTASISGTVKDDTGAVLPGVTVTARNLDTGKTRVLITDDAGRYRAPELDLGSYELQAELSGFQTTVRSGITLTLGREAIVDMVLKVGELTEKVVVQGEAALVETTSATVAGLVDDKKIRDLPLNGRDFTQLALLQEGVASPAGRGRPQPGNEGQKLSVGGTRTTQTAFLLDGTDLRNLWATTPGSATGLVLGVETVREFTVITSTASAEYGGFSGGVVNAVTRSGTNQLHGSLFEFHRNSAFDARNFFDTGNEPPAFKRNQFGFTLGGPIRRDQTFFFGSYEGLRERLTTTAIRVVPDAGAHQGILPERLGGNVGVHPSVKPYLDGYPLPNGRIFGDGTGELIFGHPQPTDQNYYMAKVDHQLGPSDSIFVRYTADQGVRGNLSSLPLWNEKVLNLNQYVTIDERKIFSAKLINQFLFAFNRSQSHGEHESSVDPKLKFIPTPDRSWGSISVPPLVGWGPFAVILQSNILNRFEYGDTVVYTSGRHAIKTGVRITRFQLNIVNPFRSMGTYQFNNLRAFLEGQPRLFFGVVTPLIRQGIRQSMVGSFIQDDFKILPNLTLNLGLRHEFITNPTEVAGRISNLDDVTGSTMRVGNPWLERNPSLKSFAPRFGFAWDPFKDGKMSVRGGFGIFYDMIGPPTYQGAPQVNPPFFIQASVVNPRFPDVFSTLGDLRAVSPNIWVIPEPEQAYVMQYNLTLQREILPSTVVTVGYFGSRGVHLNRFTDANIALTTQRVDGRIFFPPDAQRRNPAFSQLRVFFFESNSFYNSFRLGLSRRFRNGFQMQSSYNYSRSIDDSSNTTPIDSTSSPNGVSNMPDDHKYDRGLSGFDVRHVYVANATYELPFGPGKPWGTNLSGFAAKLAGGWQINTIINLTTGIPLNIRNGFERSRSRAGTDLSERPDLRPGANNNPVLGGPDRYYDPGAFVLQPAGFFGNLGRDTIIGPGLANWDIGLVKDTPFGEGKSVQFRAEFFNVANRANFGSPAPVVFTSATGIALGNAGRITGTTTTSRQIQVALKVIF